tara:strand:- start:380 stop:490 length:111 start_codon:yes stop_codon:yes gene_type:complete
MPGRDDERPGEVEEEGKDDDDEGGGVESPDLAELLP